VVPEISKPLPLLLGFVEDIFSADFGEVRGLLFTTGFQLINYSKHPRVRTYNFLSLAK